MAKRPITVRINVTRIAKEHMYRGERGVYLDLTLWQKDKPDQYGNTHMVCQAVSKEAREKNIKGPILGDAKVPETAPAQSQQPARKPSPPPSRPPADPDLDSDDGDEIPF